MAAKFGGHFVKNHSKTRLFCPVFEWSAIFLAFESRTGFFPASLDSFVTNKIFFMTLFFIKRSRLVLGLFFRLSDGLAIEWSGLA
jgi:hypothetical protein